MAKKIKITNKEIMLAIGIALIVIGLSSFGNLASVLLVVIGGYLLWNELRKKK